MLLFLPATPLSLSPTLEGFFALIRLPSWALALPRALLPELPRMKDTVRYAAPGAEVSGTPSRTTDANLDLVLAHIFHNDP